MADKTEWAGLFRREALEHRAAASEPGGVLRMDDWVMPAWWLAIASVVVASVLAFTVKVTPSLTAQGMAESGRVDAVFGQRDASSVRPGTRAEFSVGGGRPSTHGRVVGVERTDDGWRVAATVDADVTGPGVLVVRSSARPLIRVLAPFFRNE